MKIMGLYWVTEVKRPQPVIDRKTKRLRESKVKPRIVSRRLAIITAGQREVGGRISNFWNWTYFDETNTCLSNDKACGYPNGAPYFFEEATGFDINIIVTKKSPVAKRKAEQNAA